MKRRARVDDPPAGDQRLLLWYKHAAEDQFMEEQLAQIVLETGEDLPVNPSAPPGDEKRLRGIPVTGFGGAIAGTNPEGELLARERRRARHWE